LKRETLGTVFALMTRVCGPDGLPLCRIDSLDYGNEK
jgi:hypothetical protein